MHHFRREPCCYAARRTWTLLVALSICLAASGMCRSFYFIRTSNIHDNSVAKDAWLLTIATRRNLTMRPKGKQRLKQRERCYSSKIKLQLVFGPNFLWSTVCHLCCLLMNRRRKVKFRHTNIKMEFAVDVKTIHSCGHSNMILKIISILVDVNRSPWNWTFLIIEY